jgi:hypothetical protein
MMRAMTSVHATDTFTERQAPLLRTQHPPDQPAGGTNSAVEKRTETSNFVIPAKAGIQDVDETIDLNSWTPAFAGVTNPFFQQPANVALHNYRHMAVAGRSSG